MIGAGLLVWRILACTGHGQGILAGAAVSLAYLLIFATTNHLALIFGASFLKGIAEALIVAASYAAASVMIPPRRRARWFGLFNATYFLSWGLAGTLIAGPLVDLMIRAGHTTTWAYRISYLAAFGLTLSGVILLGCLFFGRRQIQHAADLSGKF
jgi:MFS family permease